MWGALRRGLTPSQRSSSQGLSAMRRMLSTKSEAELAMQASLESQLEATHVKVLDVSGGCGAMYDIEIVSPRFVGQSRVKQHRMVNEALKNEIKEMHGLTIRTLTPEQFAAKQ
ncbi:hypothetical protein Poli38472_006967 [Pythium oligandrum]|uniref:Bola-like protein n=1 Tax=Pythium oligandrum TaxID=41045 RepID=A0A8K1C935_PYTOL|nr:hypothetical protein Poli38472_006967 [Pythium oligandrum]|eukprot:TMW58822.1 hypothetical protein Poli38472_006967 [Pythium oligandrum]